jgi:polyisoprenoid-binding protein YceI
MNYWKIDPVHSEVNFAVKHMLVSTVRGHFDTFDAVIENAKEDFSDARVRFDADLSSINTKNAQRDEHLKSTDFFDAKHFAKLSFESTSVKKLSDHELEVLGNLTIRGTTKQVSLAVLFNGIVDGFGGARVAGFEIHTKLNRFDFGLKWNALTESGGVIVSNEVKIEIFAEFTKTAGID